MKSTYKYVAGALLATGLSFGAYTALDAANSTWASNEKAVRDALAHQLVVTGAPSQQVADDIAACATPLIVHLATHLECPLETANIMGSLDACAAAHPLFVQQVQPKLVSCISQILIVIPAPQ